MRAVTVIHRVFTHRACRVPLKVTRALSATGTLRPGCPVTSSQAARTLSLPVHPTSDPAPPLDGEGGTARGQSQHPETPTPGPCRGPSWVREVRVSVSVKTAMFETLLAVDTSWGEN